MDRPFEKEVVRGGLLVKLCGLIKPGKKPDDDVLLSVLVMERYKGPIKNYVAIVGSLDGLSLAVYEHLDQGKTVRELSPYYNRDEIRKFEGDNDMYVVLTNDAGAKRFFTVGHRGFQKDVVVWEGFECDGLPMEIKNWTDKVPTQSLDLSKAAKFKSADGDGNNGGDGRPSGELDPAAVQTIVDGQLDHGEAKREAQTQVN
jgi:hypothetical protein